MASREQLFAPGREDLSGRLSQQSDDAVPQRRRVDSRARADHAWDDAGHRLGSGGPAAVHAAERVDLDSVPPLVDRPRQSGWHGDLGGHTPGYGDAGPRRATDLGG